MNAARFGTLVLAFVAGTLVTLAGVRYTHDRQALKAGAVPAPATASSAPATPTVAPDPEKTAPSANASAIGLEDADLLLYVEAINQIRAQAIRLRPDVTRAEIVDQSLRAYVAQRDPCCAYLTREEYRRFKESLNESYVGIGMELTPDRAGRMICLPHPEGPAARAGIARGSVLKRIDGAAVDGQSIFNLAALARGRPGTEVTLTVTAPDGREREFRVARASVALPSVSTRDVDGSQVVVLSSFARDTRSRLTDVVGHWAPHTPIIIDLRGNGGGDLHAAIDSAMLFLAEGRRIVSVETRKGTRSYESRGAVVDPAAAVYLWQDEGTASAAEVFIAALTENDRAVSIGKRSAGRAVREEIVELSNGSALVLATGNLQTPKGLRYQGKGLAPTHEMSASAADTLSYLRKARESYAARRSDDRRGAEHLAGIPESSRTRRVGDAMSGPGRS
jgi:carboxyl-terminal processing protease